MTLLLQNVDAIWYEGDTKYATVVMTWTALDYTVNPRKSPSDGEYVVDGDANRPTEATEVWTFMKIAGGVWILSAIEQTD